MIKSEFCFLCKRSKTGIRILEVQIINVVAFAFQIAFK